MFNLSMQLWSGRASGMATGGVWYVADTAITDGGSGTKADPWQTFASIVWASVLPGHTLDGMDDTFAATLTVPKSGNSGNPIKIRKITATEITSTFDYLTIYNCNGLIDIDGDDCLLYANTGSVECSGTDNIVWKNTSTIIDTGTNTKTWYNKCTGGAGYGIHISSATNPDIKYNYSYDNTSEDILVEGSSSILVAHNLSTGVISVLNSDGDIYHNQSDTLDITVDNNTTKVTPTENNIADITLTADGASSVLTIAGGFNCLPTFANVVESELDSGTVNYTGAANDLGATDPDLTVAHRLNDTSPCLNQGDDVGYTQGIAPDSTWPNIVGLEDYTIPLVDDPEEGVDPPDTLIPNETGIHIGPWGSGV